MIDKNAFAVDMDKPEDDSSLNKMTTNLGQIGTECLEASIEDVRNTKKTIVSKIDSVTNLMKEVEYQEKAAKQAKMEADQIHSDTMTKVYELMEMQQHINKKNIMLAGETYLQKKLLSAKMETLQLHVTSLMEKGDKSLEILDEMTRSLETKLASVMMKKNLEIKKKKENEAFARELLAYEQIQMKKVEEESKRLKQESVEISKFQDFLIDREHLVTVLHGQITEKCQDLKLLKDELDQVVGFFDTDLKNSIGVEEITKNIKKVKIKGESRDYGLFAKCIKKVKIKDKQHGNKMFDKSTNKTFTKSNKKLNPKGEKHERRMCAKSIKKLKIKGVRYGSQMRAKKIKNLKVKCKVNGNQICGKSIKKLKIKGKRFGSQMCAKNIKNLKIKVKSRESQTRVYSIKKMKIKRKLHRNLCAKRIKKETTGDYVKLIIIL